MVDEVTIEEDGPLLLIGVNRPDAHNLWNLEVIQAVCRAYKRLADMIAKVDKQHSSKGNCLFYLAVAPRFFEVRGNTRRVCL